MELVHIAANKNTVSEDVSAVVPCGIRMGTPALTSRGFLEEDFAKVAEFFDAKKFPNFTFLSWMCAFYMLRAFQPHLSAKYTCFAFLIIICDICRWKIEGLYGRS